MLFNIRVCNAGWHPIRTPAVYSDFDHPERLKQMQPLGNFVWETLRDKQNEAPDLNVGCLVSLWKRVFSE